MTVYAKLLAVQAALKAPKGQYNSFGKYKYRSCEDILEALKPVLVANQATVFISDEMVNTGDRIYVKATATFIDVESGEVVLNSAYAREAESKKGMDDSQVTGTASSYARKYALNGLFLIDDTKDADTDEYHNQNEKPQQDTNKPVRFVNGRECEVHLTRKDGGMYWYSVEKMSDRQLNWVLMQPQYADAHDAVKACMNAKGIK